MALRRSLCGPVFYQGEDPAMLAILHVDGPLRGIRAGGGVLGTGPLLSNNRRSLSSTQEASMAASTAVAQ
jgi:hypothetical protein